ncbi:unnamed protein product [Trifolium pratense]|uniref:Uncharacterized protein n=1 Tax=Trifolium pratense TaxID=57577 RepID=A0ACB0JPW2_TRIPR|nr:unnamed protein product [Trifolium pratense]
MQPSYCLKENKPCVGWVQNYFSDCLCNINDEISFAFGFISLICWGVAEIPQIITNFRAKSSHGVSLVFLLTWVAGDIFNLVGCLLEPATLPTQYYTALLYTITTIVLVLQSFYYDYIYKWCKRRQKINPEEGAYGTFLAASINLPMQGNALKVGYMRLSGRKLLSQEHVTHSALGQWLGWLMAAIYTGGRIPQIWLNIKRGSVEGLNPFMFIFALIANSAYVGSILVRTTEWESIKANMPWLLDAIVCVALDLFIILQYINYRYHRKTSPSEYGNCEDYKEARKTIVS